MLDFVEALAAHPDATEIATIANMTPASRDQYASYFAICDIHMLSLQHYAAQSIGMDSDHDRRSDVMAAGGGSRG